MFKALREFTQGDRLVQVGEVVENASTRMIELGLVEVVADEAKAEKPKKEPKVKETKTKEVKEETKTEEVKEQILTEDSANVTVEKTETEEKAAE